MAKLPQTYQVTIANGASLSGAIALGTGVLVGIVLPAAWTTANLTLVASVDGGAWQNVYDEAGNELTITVGGASRYIALDRRYVFGLGQLKLRSGTSGSAVNQAADRVLTLVVREE